jgi:hypothetical protein
MGPQLKAPEICNHLENGNLLSGWRALSSKLVSLSRSLSLALSLSLWARNYKRPIPNIELFFVATKGLSDINEPHASITPGMCMADQWNKTSLEQQIVKYRKTQINYIIEPLFKKIELRIQAKHAPAEGNDEV